MSLNCWCCITVSLFLQFPVIFCTSPFSLDSYLPSKAFWLLLVICSPTHEAHTNTLSGVFAASVHCLFQNHFIFLVICYSDAPLPSTGNTINNIIYCYVINYSKTWLLKLVNIYLFTIFMVKNPASLGNFGFRSLMRLRLKFWLEMKSTEGLTGAEDCFQMAHLQGCWQKASICHWLFDRSSEFLITYPIHRAVWVFMAADL